MLAQAVATLHRIGGRGLVREVQATFLASAPALLEAASAAARAGDLEEVAQAAKALQSTAVQLGAVRLQRLCAVVEQSARNDRPERLAGALEEAGRELRRVHNQLKEATRRMHAATAKPRILLIEDNADNRQLIRVMLAEDYEVVEYASGAEALREMAGRSVDLVFMDISLPGMDGIETLTRWRSDPALKQVPVVAMTAHAMFGDRERLLAHGFDAYLSKPILEDGDVLDLAAHLIKGSR